MIKRASSSACDQCSTSSRLMVGMLGRTPRDGCCLLRAASSLHCFAGVAVVPTVKRLIGEVLGMDVFEVEYKETAEGDLVDYKAKFLLDSGWRASRLNVVHPLHKYKASESWR